jgi:hypothetical protein
MARSPDLSSWSFRGIVDVVDAVEVDDVVVELDVVVDGEVVVPIAHAPL